MRGCEGYKPNLSAFEGGGLQSSSTELKGPQQVGRASTRLHAPPGGAAHIGFGPAAASPARSAPSMYPVNSSEASVLAQSATERDSSPCPSRGWSLTQVHSGTGLIFGLATQNIGGHRSTFLFIKRLTKPLPPVDQLFCFIGWLPTQLTAR